MQVFATDLWIAASENYARFKEAGLEQGIIPIHADVADLPYADEYFDAIISIDSYQYFGREEGVADKENCAAIEKGSEGSVVVPGLIKDIHDNIPPEMLLSWNPEDIETLRSPNGGESSSQGRNYWSLKRWGSWKASMNAGTTGWRATMNMPSATGKPWKEGRESIWIWFT